MRQRHPELPRLWLVSDARNDAVLPAAIARLPRGAGLILRHHHLPQALRQARLAVLARAARARGLAVVVAGDAALARRWRADGAYGAAARLAGGGALLRLITAHSLAEIAAAHRARASAILLSPAFATRSHPGAPALGPVRWRLLAARCLVPVIALGGLTRHSARRLGARACHGWAAIDGLS